MNVILQSLCSIPVFYNFLVHLNEQIETNSRLKGIFNKNHDDSYLIANFLELIKYMSPETGNPLGGFHYSNNIVSVEDIFKNLLMNFNPDRQQQDCHEFLGLMLDTLNNELHEILEKVGISTKNKNLTEAGANSEVEEWEESGKKRLKVKNKAEDLIKNSPIFEIFGGCMREDICVEGKNTDSARLQPYLYLSLEINMDCTIDSSLRQYFEPEELEDFKFGKKHAYATKTHSLLTVPNIFILHLKRFLYIDGPIKTTENVYYPDILELRDEYFAPEIQDQRKRARSLAEEQKKASEQKPAKVVEKATEESKIENKEEVKTAIKEEVKVVEDSAPKKKGKKTNKNKIQSGVKVQVHEQSEEQKLAFSQFKNLEKYELIGVIVHKGK
jgi:ubiquitin C-terminal hydrolase